MICKSTYFSKRVLRAFVEVRMKDYQNSFEHQRHELQIWNLPEIKSWQLSPRVYTSQIQEVYQSPEVLLPSILFTLIIEFDNRFWTFTE